MGMKFIAFSLCLPLVVLGCSSKDSGGAPTESTVRGTLALSTFSATPTGIQAIDENGAKITGKLAADGSFSLVLPKDHTYRLVVTTASASEPIVFPRTTGKLDTTFRMSGGGAAVALGSVRHYDSAPAGGFMSVGTSKQLRSSEPAPAEGDGDGECEDGVDAATGAACVDDDADPTGAMAVPEHNAPDDVAGCDEEGEEEDDD
jgi:hypothetical protein